MNLEDHAEELASDLGVDKAEVTTDLENLVQYSVPIDEAKQSLRRKYGDGGDDGTPSEVDMSAITTDSGNVTVTGRILTVGKRSIRYQGEDQVIFEGQIADQTGRVDYTAWEDFGLSPGDTITAGNAGVREWEGEPELNLGQSTTVSFRTDALEIPFEVGGESDLADLEPGDRGRAVEVTVLEVERRTIDGRDGETEILSGVLADETGRLPFTDWNPHPDIENEGDVRIEDVYIREFRGVPSVNVTEFSRVSPLSREIEVGESGTQLAIADAVATGGLYDVEVVGTCISIRDGSGLIERCPECNRVVQKGQCRTHGEVEGEEDLRVKAIIDDGTGTLTAVLDADLTADVYGGDVDDAKEQAREAMDQSVVADAIRENVAGREFRVRGHLSVDEYGANCNAATFEAVEDEPADRARTLLEEVEP